MKAIHLNPAAAAVLATLALAPGESHVFSYAASYMTSWSGCQCNNSSLR